MPRGAKHTLAVPARSGSMTPGSRAPGLVGAAPSLPWATSAGPLHNVTAAGLSSGAPVNGLEGAAVTLVLDPPAVPPQPRPGRPVPSPTRNNPAVRLVPPPARGGVGCVRHQAAPRQPRPV